MPRLKSSKPEYHLPPKPSRVSDWARRQSVDEALVDAAMIELIADGESDPTWIRSMVRSRRNKVAW